VIEAESKIIHSMMPVITSGWWAIYSDLEFLWELNAAMTFMRFWLHHISYNPCKSPVSQTRPFEQVLGLLEGIQPPNSLKSKINHYKIFWQVSLCQ
jgi:hypothetical protein